MAELQSEIGEKTMQGTISEEVFHGLAAIQPGQELQNNVHSFLSVRLVSVC